MATADGPRPEARRAPPVIVRDHEVEQGFFQLDPCNLHPGEAPVVADRILAARAATIAP